jgi:hypothetical protein
MLINKSNIAQNPNVPYKDEYFANLDCYHNFSQCLDRAARELMFASRYLIFNTKLHEKLDKIRDLLAEIEVDK